MVIKPTAKTNEQTVSTEASISVLDQVAASFKAHKKAYFIGLGIIGVILLALVGFLIYKKIRKPKEHKKQALLCPGCHKKLEGKDQKFCHNCGHKVIHSKKEAKEDAEKEKNKE